MTLVDGPDTIQSESTGDQTGIEGNGDPANADAPDVPDPLESEPVQDQEGLQEDHPSPADGDLELDVNEDREEVTLEGDYLPVLNDISNTPRSQTVEENQEVPQFEQLANEMDEKLEKILQSVQRTSGHRKIVS